MQRINPARPRHRWPIARPSRGAAGGGVGAIAVASLVLHVGAALGVLLARFGPALDPPEPARIEVVFGRDPLPPVPQAGVAAPAAPHAPAAAPAPPGTAVPTSGEVAATAPTRPASTVAPAAPPVPLAASAATAPGSERAGVLVERPDPTMIPARDDPGNVPPPYPEAARRDHVQGTVLVRLHIDETGRVAWLETLHTSGSAILDEAAERTLARWHFLPARQAGVPVPSYRDQPVRFAMD